MTGQTVGSAVAVKQKSDQLVTWLRGQQNELAMAAASHIKPSTIIRVAQGALRKDDKLMAAAVANPLSLLHCCLDAARLGHEPGTDQYYLVPFGSEVTGIEGYKGIIERMFRAGGVSTVVAQVVRQRDHYVPRGENTPPVHDYDDFASAADRGPLRGAYAYAIFPSGVCSQVIRMGHAEIMEHKAKSRGSDKADSPWQVWPAAMWKKTVLRALEPYVPTSSEWLNTRALAAAQGAQPAVVHRIANGTGVPSDGAEPIDAEIVDEPSGPAVPDESSAGTDPAAGPETKSRTPRRQCSQPRGGQSQPSAPPLAEQIGRQFDRLGVGDNAERVEYVTRMAGDGAALDTPALSRVLADLGKCEDIGQLQALITTGDAPASEAASDG